MIFNWIVAAAVGPVAVVAVVDALVGTTRGLHNLTLRHRTGWDDPAPTALLARLPATEAAHLKPTRRGNSHLH